MGASYLRLFSGALLGVSLQYGAALVATGRNGGERREHLWRRVVVHAVQEDADNDEPVLVALTPVVGVRLLRVAVLVTRVHAHRYRLC